MTRARNNTDLIERFRAGHTDLKVNNLEVRDFKLYHYGTLIAWFEIGQVVITDRHYSTTTSRICNQLERLVQEYEDKTPERKDPAEAGVA